MAVKSVQNYPAPLILVQAGWITGAQVTLDGTTCWAFSIIPTSNPFSGAMSLSEIRAFFSSATGSPKVTPYLYSDNAATAKPNAVVTNGNGVESGVLSNGWNSFSWTGTLPALTAGVRYWIVLKCTSGTSIRVNHLTVPANVFSLYGTMGGANGRCETASGVDGIWAGTQYSDVAGVRVGITDGTDTAYWGMPVSTAFGALSTTGNRIDGTQSIGTTITIPDNATFRLRNFVSIVTRVGSPGNLTCVIYKGTSTIPTATSEARISTDIITASSTVYHFDFNPAVSLTAGATYRIVLSAATGSNAANYYYFNGITTLDSDANSLALSRWGNHIAILSGGSWSETTTTLVQFGIILDMTTGPFVSSGGSNQFITSVGDLGSMGTRRFGQFRKES